MVTLKKIGCEVCAAPIPSVGHTVDAMGTKLCRTCALNLVPIYTAKGLQLLHNRRMYDFSDGPVIQAKSDNADWSGGKGYFTVDGLLSLINGSPEDEDDFAKVKMRLCFEDASYEATISHFDLADFLSAYSVLDCGYQRIVAEYADHRFGCIDESIISEAMECYCCDYRDSVEYITESYLDCMDVPDHIMPYVDLDALARDVIMGGDYLETDSYLFDMSRV